MKKYLLTALIAFFTCSFAASAQEKGDMAVGVDLGFAPCFTKNFNTITNFGIGVKYQYNITDPIRLEADLEYWLKNRQLSVFDVTANVQYLVGLSDKWNIYPTAGIGIGHVSVGTKFFEGFATGGQSWDKFLFNIGIGGEYKLSDNLSIDAQFKYQYMQHFSRLPIQVGLLYRF